uniref:Uncharacterized protein n=1 Tax=Octopus bimaculoides TaxID=37653 RepID=A0A0L8GP88_OCTBM
MKVEGLALLFLLSVSYHLVVSERKASTSNPLDSVTWQDNVRITLPEPKCGHTTFLKTQCYQICPAGHLIVSGLKGCQKGWHCCTS